ncbi:hypothetical protein [uncultured Anaerofustis sp.]|uniref:hypothetical protein n=1 Tax=uncultured Anaerofustis sp. TaxID=904996 RepID=UPI0025F46D9B|nr:hypothetical protein [uncultured Anaerofustis sp.]
MSLIATLIGIFLGMICFSMWSRYMQNSVKKETENLDEHNFTVKKPKSKVVFHSVILFAWVIIFALYQSGIIFEKNIFFYIVTALVVVMSLYRIQYCIYRKITVEGEKITDTKGNVYYFSDFTSCKIIDSAFMLFIDNTPTLKLERDDIGYDTFLKRVFDTGMKVVDLRKNK